MESIIVLLLTAIIVIYYSIQTYYKTKQQYWKNKGVLTSKAKFPFGTFQNPFTQKMPGYMWLKEQYDFFKSQKKQFGGMYLGTKPSLLIVDPKLVKIILTQDFHNFMDRGTYYNEKHDPLSAHLFNLEGQKWKRLRAKLSPTFTSGKMKLMFEIMLVCSENMIEKMESLHVQPDGIDIKEIVACFTTDVIGSAAFGLDCNSFKDENSAFRYHGRKLMENTPSRLVRFLLSGMFPNLSKKLGVVVFEKYICDFFYETVKDVVEYRESNNVKRNDFLQILLELKTDHGDENLTLAELAAQAFIFWIAGFETSSTTMHFFLFEVAKNQNIQDRLREEIGRVFAKHGKMNYEAMNEMTYLHQAISETLRKYPPLAMLFRKCLNDYKLPNTDVTLEKDTKVFIPTMGLHYDPEYFPNPEVFDPDRFSDENKPRISPYVYLPFGEGPRICIGLRFGLMQAKIGLASILKNYKLTVNPRTADPIKLHRTSFIVATEDPIYLDAEKVK